MYLQVRVLNRNCLHWKLMVVCGSVIGRFRVVYALVPDFALSRNLASQSRILRKLLGANLTLRCTSAFR
jgi:hypothetical protein